MADSTASQSSPEADQTDDERGTQAAASAIGRHGDHGKAAARNNVGKVEEVQVHENCRAAAAGTAGIERKSENEDTRRNTQSENEREGHGVVQPPNSDGSDADTVADVDMVADADMVAGVLPSLPHLLPISSLWARHMAFKKEYF